LTAVLRAVAQFAEAEVAQSPKITSGGTGFDHGSPSAAMAA
jgi:hypothetical protein